MSAGLSGPAIVQDAYPSRAIKFVVPFAAGSATDTLARVLGQNMSASLGHRSWSTSCRSPAAFWPPRTWPVPSPTAYTVLITSNTTHAANQNLFKKLPYDPIATSRP